MTFVIGEVEVTNEVSLASSAALYDGATSADGDLTVKVNSFYYDMGGTKGKYVGSVANPVSDDSVNYVYLDGAETLQINTVGYPAGVNIRLARVVASGGFVTRVILERPFFTASADGSGGVVPTSRQIIAGAGLTGGGDLSANRTLDVIANIDGSIIVNPNDIQVGTISDIQHGTRGGGTQHGVATQFVDGFMSSSDKAKLDAYPNQVPDDTLVFGANSVGTTTTSRFLVFGSMANIAPISSQSIRSSRVGTLSNMRVRHNLTGTGGAIVYTLLVNGVDTILTASAGAGTTGGEDTAHSVIVSASDLLDVKATKMAGISISPRDITVTIEFNG